MQDATDAFFDHTLDLACTTSGDHFIRVNKQWRLALGWSDEELLSRPFMEFVHPEDRAATADAVTSLMAGEPLVSFENRYLTVGGQWATLEWSAIADEAAGTVYCRARDVTADRAALAERDAMHRVVSAQAELHDLFFRHGVSRAWWDIALSRLLEVTGSAFGFVGSVEYEAEDAPMLRSLAVSDIAWNEWSRAAFDQFASTGLEFRKLDSLYGATLRTGQMVVSDDPATDPRSSGLPEGHPPLHSYIGIPLVDGHGMVGMAGLANRPGGYSTELMASLKPILSVMTHIISRDHADRQVADATRALATLQREGHAHSAVAQGVDAILVSDSFERGCEKAREVIHALEPAVSVAIYKGIGSAGETMTLVVGDADAASYIDSGACEACSTGRLHVNHPDDDDAATCAHAAGGPVATICAPVRTEQEWFGLVTVAVRTEGALNGTRAELASLADAVDRLEGALAQIALRDDLAGSALQDGLTGLPNRTAFMQAVDRRLQLLRSSARPFGVLIVDVDRFKDVNDTFGHQAGDEALSAVAAAIRSAVRISDLPSRLGGDEFAVLVDADSDEDVRAIAERIVTNVGATVSPAGAPLSASVGGVLVGWGPLTWGDAYAAADAALYTAKASGRGCVHVADMLGGEDGPAL